ncbi:hypothetical protein [Pseudodesulfovibrio sp.]|nr:hypothetical protein [Pseudodesulfovibrio sp.]MDD3312058.1 hypothetical protein [Pseudodesulfovibrio sp.]
MRRLLPCLLLAILSLFPLQAGAKQPVLTLLYSANTYGVIKPCPS